MINFKNPLLYFGLATGWCLGSSITNIEFIIPCLFCLVGSYLYLNK